MTFLNARLVSTAILLLGIAGQTEATGIVEWINSSLQRGDELLCRVELNDEKFFVARNEQRVKLGYRVKIIPPTSPFSLVASWNVSDDAGKRVIAPIPPTSIVNRTVELDGQLFSESVEYQSLTGLPPSIRAQIRIKKCLSDQCERSRKLSERETEYVVEVCK